jgi:hypothetical protein
MPRFLVTYYAGDMASDAASITDARRAFVHWAELAGQALARSWDCRQTADLQQL